MIRARNSDYFPTEYYLAIFVVIETWRIQKENPTRCNSVAKFLAFMGLCNAIIFYYINPNKMHMLRSLFYLTTALHVSGVTITHPQEHKQL
jgi:hypothetical protein